MRKSIHLHLPYRLNAGDAIIKFQYTNSLCQINCFCHCVSELNFQAYDYHHFDNHLRHADSNRCNIYSYTIYMSIEENKVDTYPGIQCNFESM